MYCRGGTGTDTDLVTITTDLSDHTGLRPVQPCHPCHHGVRRLTPWSVMFINQGCHPRGDRIRDEQKRRGGPRTNFSVVVAPLVYGHRSNFREKMSKSPDSLPNVSCFDLFLKDPKGCKIEVIQGAHKFMIHIIKGTE